MENITVAEEVSMEGKVKLPYRVRDAGAHDHQTASDGTLTNFVEGGHSHILSDMATILKGGDHGHPYVMGNSQTTNDGKHVHEVILSDGKKVMTDPGGGEHRHEVNPGPRTSYESGQHGHSVKMPDGKVYQTLNHLEIQAFMDQIQKKFEIEAKIEEDVGWDLNKISSAQDIRLGKTDTVETSKKE